MFFTKYLTWILAGALAAALGLVGLQTVRLAGERTAHAETKAAHAQVLTGIANLATAAAEKATRAQHLGQKATAAIDAQRTKEKADHAKTTDALRADVAAGKRRLRVNATCPAGSGGVPASARPARVDAAAGPELTEDARSAYFALRTEITDTAAALAGLQQYVREVCLADH